jgi:hypothetical protein
MADWKIFRDFTSCISIEGRPAGTFHGAQGRNRGLADPQPGKILFYPVHGSQW